MSTHFYDGVIWREESGMDTARGIVTLSDAEDLETGHGPGWIWWIDGDYGEAHSLEEAKRRVERGLR